MKKMNKNNIAWSSARKICIVTTLASLGHYPTRKSEKEAWFLSPLRSETQASFSVSLKKNLWFDFGLGKGGNIIDLMMAMNHCSAYIAVQSLQEKNYFSFSPETFPPTEGSIDAIKILKVKDISHPALINYTQSRAVPVEIARSWCKEIHFSLKGKAYFSLGLQNNTGGWELRNKYFKGSSAPKSYSYFAISSKRLLIIEGMFDLLSLAILEKEMVESSDLLILNSLCFLNKGKQLLSGYKQIHIYLDNDPAGDLATNELMRKFGNATDKRFLYRQFKDLNERLQNEQLEAGIIRKT